MPGTPSSSAAKRIFASATASSAALRHARLGFSNESSDSSDYGEQSSSLASLGTPSMLFLIAPKRSVHTLIQASAVRKSTL